MIKCDKNILTTYRRRVKFLKQVFGIALCQSIIGNTVQLEDSAVDRAKAEIAAHERNIRVIEFFIAKGILTF
jgi:hypothetical protein